MSLNPSIPVGTDGLPVDFMVPSQPDNIYGDLTSLDPLPGQNTRPPSEKMFGSHVIVKVDSSLLTMDPGLGPYFDPSYGVTYSDANDFELKAVDAYVVRDVVNFPGDAHMFKALAIRAIGRQYKITLNP